MRERQRMQSWKRQRSGMWGLPVVWMLAVALLLSACGDGTVESFTEPAPAQVQEEAVSQARAPETSDPEGDEIPEDAPSQADWADAFAAYVQDVMAEEGIPGVALALVADGEVVLAQGYGLRNVAEGLPVTSDTLFHIGSTHKSMNALLIATLVDDGLLDWDEPVRDYAPDFALSDDEATQAVTIRHLLSMTSGIPDDAENDYFDGATPEDVFDIIAQAELLGAPGEVFSYSNLSASAAGYAGVLAADASAADLYAGYAALFQARVLDPMGMESATLSVGAAQRSPDHARSYTLGGDEDGDDAPVLTETYDVEGDALAPSGSLKASAAEMARYILTQLNEGVAPNGNRVVSAENLAETWQPLLEGYALGWEVTAHSGIQVISHEGAYDDFVSVIGFMPDEEVGFVILVNSETAGEPLINDGPAVLADLLP